MMKVARTPAAAVGVSLWRHPARRPPHEDLCPGEDRCRDRRSPRRDEAVSDQSVEEFVPVEEFPDTGPQEHDIHSQTARRGKEAPDPERVRLRDGRKTREQVARDTAHRRFADARRTSLRRAVRHPHSPPREDAPLR